MMYRGKHVKVSIREIPTVKKDKSLEPLNYSPRSLGKCKTYLELQFLFKEYSTFYIYTDTSISTGLFRTLYKVTKFSFTCVINN